MPLTQTRSLAAARDALLGLPQPFTPDGVQEVVQSFRPAENELEPYLNFSDRSYTRTLFFRGPRFEILVLCWKPGQVSPIHDHASSICAMAVVEGRARSDSYLLTGGQIQADQGRSLDLARTDFHAKGQVVTVVGGEIHQVGNFQEDGSDLVTVHFYLPPIESMRCFDKETGRCQMVRPETLPPRL